MRMEHCAAATSLKQSSWLFCILAEYGQGPGRFTLWGHLLIKLNQLYSNRCLLVPLTAH
jgi:hypothetical protein